jgi:hypothetical protein
MQLDWHRWGLPKQQFRHRFDALSSQIEEGGMLKYVAATLAYASALALLIVVFHYEPPVGSNVQQIQRPQDWSNQKCPPGKRWNGNAGKRMCE